jgi:hypothetical protein
MKPRRKDLQCAVDHPDVQYTIKESSMRLFQFVHAYTFRILTASLSSLSAVVGTWSVTACRTDEPMSHQCRKTLQVCDNENDRVWDVDQACVNDRVVTMFLSAPDFLTCTCTCTDCFPTRRSARRPAPLLAAVCRLPCFVVLDTHHHALLYSSSFFQGCSLARQRSAGWA